MPTLTIFKHCHATRGGGIFANTINSTRPLHFHECRASDSGNASGCRFLCKTGCSVFVCGCVCLQGFHLVAKPLVCSIADIPALTYSRRSKCAGCYWPSWRTLICTGFASCLGQDFICGVSKWFAGTQLCLRKSVCWSQRFLSRRQNRAKGSFHFGFTRDLRQFVLQTFANSFRRRSADHR